MVTITPKYKSENRLKKTIKKKYKTLFKKPKTNLQNTVNKITEPKSY